MDDAAENLARFFDGENLAAKASLAAYLVSVGEDGWPHSAMISAGELLITAGGDARLALWAHSRSTANIARTSLAVLLIVLDGRAIRARLTLHVVDTDDALHYFVGAITDMAADTAPYAELRDGIRFELRDEADTLARWARTLARLRRISNNARG